MQARSDEVAPEIRTLRVEIDRVLPALAAAEEALATVKVLAEALTATELAGEGAAVALEGLARTFDALDAALDGLGAAAEVVDEQLKMIRFLELQGRIEAARADDTQHVRTLFEEIGGQVRKGGDQLQELLKLRGRRDRGARDVLRVAEELSRTARRE